MRSAIPVVTAVAASVVTAAFFIGVVDQRIRALEDARASPRQVGEVLARLRAVETGLSAVGEEVREVRVLLYQRAVTGSDHPGR